jgi:hypothetical protein
LYSQLCLEYGIFSRLLELAVVSNSLSRDNVVLTICCLSAQSHDILHRKAMFYRISCSCMHTGRSFARFFIDGVMQLAQSLHAYKDILQYIHGICQLHADYYTGFLQANLLDALAKVISSEFYDGKVEAGYILCDAWQRPGDHNDSTHAAQVPPMTATSIYCVVSALVRYDMSWVGCVAASGVTALYRS